MQVASRCRLKGALQLVNALAVDARAVMTSGSAELAAARLGVPVERLLALSFSENGCSGQRLMIRIE
jgi:hypothetical protein